MKTRLLELFREKSNNLKNLGGTTDNSDNSVVANYTFIVSNHKVNNHDTIEVTSLSDLEFAITTYYSETNIDPKNRIIKAENLDQTKQMYVLLQLP